MIKRLTLDFTPAVAADPAAVRNAAANAAGFSGEVAVRTLRRSIDARSRSPRIILEIEVASGEEFPPPTCHTAALREVANTSPKVIIVGAGPAGYFAALELLALGVKPIVLDRGKDVRERRRDLRAIQQQSVVNPHSNYCFGEGGAGTYSDGKLYTQSTKRGNVRHVLEILVEHGSNPDILIDAHPHIGSNKLPGVVQSIRETITAHGGEVHFGAFVTGFLRRGGRITGVQTEQGEEFTGAGVILATGHSARDVFNLLENSGIPIEAKPLALGVRIEHPQALIDEIRYRQRPRSRFLPAAAYKLVTQTEGRGVFSFCMCPGGLIVPAATAPGEIVVNGMSMSRRDSRFANSGVVVQVEISDVPERFRSAGARALLEFQRETERMVFAAGNGSQAAPAQRLTDFAAGRISATLPSCSYIPGIFSADISALLAPFIATRLRKAVGDFDRQMRGYLTAEAVVVATESRTSSPVRIPRNPDSCEHPNAPGLFPCGEGAGYAGGIMSAALDGQRVARAAAEQLFVKR